MTGVAAALSPSSARAGHAAYYFGSRFAFSDGQKTKNRAIWTLWLGV